MTSRRTDPAPKFQLHDLRISKAPNLHLQISTSESPPPNLHLRISTSEAVDKKLSLGFGSTLVYKHDII